MPIHANSYTIHDFKTKTSKTKLIRITKVQKMEQERSY